MGGLRKLGFLHQRLQEIGRDVELSYSLGPFGDPAKSLGDQLAGLHAGGGKCLDHAGVDALKIFINAPTR